MKNKILFILWVIVICVAFVTLVGFSIIYGDRIQNKNLENQESQTSEDLLYKELPKQEIIVEEKEIYLLTAYCPCVECSEGYGNMTATGKQAVEGRTIAVDPDVVPYGTELYIEGIGYRIAEDCGGLVKGKHIDVYFDCHSKVDAFGKKYAEVEI